jgi:hypothetical protein
MVSADMNELDEDQMEFFHDQWKDNAAFAGGNGNNRSI